MSIYVQDATDDNKLSMLDNLLRDSGFYNISAMIQPNDPIIVKVNLAPVSQTGYRYGTDPILADAVVDILYSMGFTNVSIVEAQSSLPLARPCLTPDVQAKMFGYRHPVVDLTNTPLRSFLFGYGSVVLLSEVMLTAKFIINMPKAKNHDLMLMTGALKNMYGSIPTPDKWHQFHQRKSGLRIEEVTYYVNTTTPVGFNIVDFINSIDGDEVSFFRNEVSDFPYYPANRLVAGTDPLAIDKYLSVKMGYDQDDSPIVDFSAEMVGNYDIDDVPIHGDDLSPLDGWRRISWWKNTSAKMQDKLSVSSSLMRQGMQAYHFDACPIESEHEEHEEHERRKRERKK